MEKERKKFWIDVGMLISFLLVGITGLLKMPGWTPEILSRTANPDNFYLMSRIHDYAGIVIVILIIIHFSLNRVCFKCMAQGTFHSNDKPCKL